MKKNNKKELLIKYLSGVLLELKKTPIKAINKKNAKVIADSIIKLCE